MEHLSEWLASTIIMNILVAPIAATRHTVMLSPAGDANFAGRTLVDGFERGAARQLAEEIKQHLEQDERTRVIMSHNVGESANQEQRASFANSLGVDLYIALGIYTTQHACIDAYFYQTIANNNHTSSRLAFYPFKDQPRPCPKNVCIIPSAFHKQFVVSPLIGAPINLLEGISSPAYYIEIGLSNMQNLATFVDALCATIQGIIDEQQT